MNSLSWLLYWSGVVGSLNSFLIFAASAFCVASVVTGAGFFICRCVAADNSKYKETAEVYTTLSYTWRKFFLFFFPMFILFGVVANLVPDRRTMIMIASSEAAEKVINNEKVSKVIDPSIDLLKTYMEKEMLGLQKEIKRLKGDDK